jgi:hypothetical protein
VCGVTFLASVNPSIYELTTVSTAECIENSNIYLLLSSTLGFGIALFVTGVLCVIALWLFLSLYNIAALNTFWEPRAYFTIVTLLWIVIMIGIVIEVVAIFIEAYD